MIVELKAIHPASDTSPSIEIVIRTGDEALTITELVNLLRTFSLAIGYQHETVKEHLGEE